MTHVAFYLPSLVVGGAQRVTVTLANELSRRGYAVDLVVSYRRGELKREVDDAVSIVDLHAPRIPGVGTLASAPSLRRYVGSTSPDVLFSVMTHANVVAALAGLGRRTSTKLVPVEHNAFGRESGYRSRLTDRLAGVLYPTTDRVVAVSAGVKRSVVDGTGVAPEDVTVLTNPIPVDEIRDASADDPADAATWLRSSAYETVVSLGRLEAQKDFGTLLEAFAAVHGDRPSTRLVVVGRGSEYDSLLERTRRLGLTDVVRFTGYVANPYAIVGRGSVFVLSSIHEGLPTVLVEAMACGCPVVATDCDYGPREILADGVFGPLVPVGDAEALSEAIWSTLDGPLDSARLVRRARDFSTAAATDRYEEFVTELVASRREGVGPTQESVVGRP